MASDAKPVTNSQPTGGGPANRPRTQYSFDDDLVESLFKMLKQAKKLTLPEPKNQEDIGKIDDPRYCAYHRALGHPTKSCWTLKDKLRTLIDARILELKTELETAAADMTSFMQFCHPPPDSTALIPIPVAEIWVLNSDPHHQREKRLLPLLILDVGVMS